MATLLETLDELGTEALYFGVVTRLKEKGFTEEDIRAATFAKLVRWTAQGGLVRVTSGAVPRPPQPNEAVEVHPCLLQLTGEVTERLNWLPKGKRSEVVENILRAVLSLPPRPDLSRRTPPRRKRK